jgi:plastocyanin
MRSVFGILALATLAAVTAACGGGTNNDSTPAPAPVTPGADVTINIAGERGVQSFSPNPADAAGKRVIFHNSDGVVHRVVLNDGTIDTGNIAPNGNSAVVTMPVSGSNYHCSIHPDMIGSVNSQDGPPPACTGPYCTPATP